MKSRKNSFIFKKYCKIIIFRLRNYNKFDRNAVQEERHSKEAERKEC